MTDITELEQKPTRYGTNSQGVFTNLADGAYVSYQDFLVLVEALEKAQRANNSAPAILRQLAEEKQKRGEVAAATAFNYAASALQKELSE